MLKGRPPYETPEVKDLKRQNKGLRAKLAEAEKVIDCAVGELVKQGGFDVCCGLEAHCKMAYTPDKCKACWIEWAKQQAKDAIRAQVGS